MIKRIDIGALRFTWSLNIVIKVIGVNSTLKDGSHILMWDFDYTDLEDIKQALRKVQTRYFLSDIHIFQTAPIDGYHAYCFTAVDWRRAIEILAATDGVDMKYLKWSVYRGRFTLRVSEKFGRYDFAVATLDGYQLPDCDRDDLRSWVLYETVGGKEWSKRRWTSMQRWLTRLKLKSQRQPTSLPLWKE